MGGQRTYWKNCRRQFLMPQLTVTSAGGLEKPVYLAIGVTEVATALQS